MHVCFFFLVPPKFESKTLFVRMCLKETSVEPFELLVGLAGIANRLEMIPMCPR